MQNHKPNILIISSRADFGGGPEHIFQLVYHLQNEFNFFIACPNDYPYYKLYTELVGQDKVFEIPHRKISFSSILNLSSFIKKNKIKLIHSHGKGAGIYSRLLFLLTRKLIVHTFHGVHVEQYAKPAKAFYLFLERFLSGLTTRFISVSNSESEKIIKNKITNTNKITVIPNGVNIQQNIKHNFSEDINILFITRDDPQKNNIAAVKITKLISENTKIKNVKLNVIGCELESISAAAETEGISDLVKLHGTKTELNDYFANADFYINTSLAEGLSLSILEAMAQGLPVIASRVTGNVDIVKDNINGFLFELDKPEEVIDKIVECKLNQKLYQKISSNNINLIKEYFSVQIMAEKTKKVYTEILNNE